MGRVMRVYTDGKFELVFGEEGKPTVALGSLFVEKEGKVAVCIRIRKLRGLFSGDFCDKPDENDVGEEIGHIVFCEEGSIRAFKNQINRCQELLQAYNEGGMELVEKKFGCPIRTVEEEDTHENT